MKNLNPKQTTIALAAAIILQILVLSGMVALSAVPLWTGKEIQVKVVPVDPRSWFRGNYARLRYPFSRLSANTLKDADNLRNSRANEVVYVTLEKNKDGLYYHTGASLEKPKQGVFLRGRLNGYLVKYGIEAFFLPKEKALALEKELRSGGGIAVLMVTDSGQVALKDVKGNDE